MRSRHWSTLLVVLAGAMLGADALVEAPRDPMEEALNYPAIVKGTVIKVEPDEHIPALKNVTVRIDRRYTGKGLFEANRFEAPCGIGVMNNGDVFPIVPNVGDEALWLVLYANLQPNDLPHASYIRASLGLTVFPSWTSNKEEYAAAEALAKVVQEVTQLPPAERRPALAKLAEHPQETVVAWAYELVAQFDAERRADSRAKILARPNVCDDLLTTVLEVEARFPENQRLPPDRRKAIEERLEHNEKARRAADPDTPKLIGPDVPKAR